MIKMDIKREKMVIELKGHTFLLEESHIDPKKSNGLNQN